MISTAIKTIGSVKPDYDDDCIDRLNYAYTSGFFILLILILGMKQYVGEPIQCWLPAEYRQNWERYIENYCFVENTYFSSYDKDRFPKRELREGLELRYYQWVPFFLTAQLILFLLPKMIWSSISWKTGLNVRSIVGKLSNQEKTKKFTTKSKSLDDHTRSAFHYIQNILIYNKDRPDGFRVGGCMTHTSYLTRAYLFYKLLNCANVLAQLWAMNHFINTSYTFWGFGALKDLVEKRDWKASGNFPRVTFCDYMRREDVNGKPMAFSVECVLMLNMFNEKLYIMLWFWFTMLSICNLANLFYWIMVTYFPCFSRKFIKLQLNFCHQEYTNKEVSKFIETRLFKDGMTTLRLIAANAGPLATCDIVGMLFKDFKKDEEKMREKIKLLLSSPEIDEKLQPHKEEKKGHNFFATHHPKNPIEEEKLQKNGLQSIYPSASLKDLEN